MQPHCSQTWEPFHRRISSCSTQTYLSDVSNTNNDGHTGTALHCMVLPPSECNSIISIPLLIYHESFMMTAATVFPYVAAKTSQHCNKYRCTETMHSFIHSYSFNVADRQERQERKTELFIYVAVSSN